jgi:hypothetical protein
MLKEAVAGNGEKAKEKKSKQNKLEKRRISSTSSKCGEMK